MPHRFVSILLEAKWIRNLAELFSDSFDFFSLEQLPAFTVGNDLHAGSVAERHDCIVVATSDVGADAAALEVGLQLADHVRQPGAGPLHASRLVNHNDDVRAGRLAGTLGDIVNESSTIRTAACA